MCDGWKVEERGRGESPSPKKICDARTHIRPPPRNPDVRGASRIMASSVLNRLEASALASSVLPTPGGRWGVVEGRGGEGAGRGLRGGGRVCLGAGARPRCGALVHAPAGAALPSFTPQTGKSEGSPGGSPRTRGAEEQEAGDGPVGVLHARAAALDRLGHRRHLGERGLGQGEVIGG